MSRSRRVGFLAIGVLPVALLLGGCAGIPSIPGLPGGAGGDQTVEEFIEGAGLHIPGSDGASAWSVTIAARDEATAESAGALSEGAGFTHNGFAYERADYIVILASQTTDGVAHVAYTVAQQ